MISNLEDNVKVTEVFHEGKWISNEEYLKIVGD